MRAIIKLLGRGAIILAASTLTLANWLLSGILAAGFASSCKAMRTHDAALYPLTQSAQPCRLHRADYFSASTPACERNRPVNRRPTHPDAPITLPSTMSGLPPREAITSSSVVR